MGIIELIDANEEENCYITLDEKKTAKRTHLEIFSSSMLGAGASIIPYPEHNQSPRNTYESAMAKQSLGFSTNENTSTYVRQHLMLYPQTPIDHDQRMPDQLQLHPLCYNHQTVALRLCSFDQQVFLQDLADPLPLW